MAATPDGTAHPSTVACIGLGRMGSRLAGRLLDAGHRLRVYNRTPGRERDLVDRGARAAVNPAAAADGADVAISMVADGAALRAVALDPNGVLSADRPPRVYVDMSTVDPASSAEVAAAAGERGVAFLRAPVSGSTVLAETGALTILISGDEAAYREAEPLLRVLGQNLYYLGPGEQSRALKLALNMMVAGTIQLLAEALGVAEEAGIERARALEVIANSAVGSPLVRYKTPPLTSGDYTPAATVNLMRKDLALALAMAAERDLPLPVTALVAQYFTATAALGKGELDFAAVVPAAAEMAGRRPA